MLTQLGAVAQAGEGVVVRQPAEPALRHLALGDVSRHAAPTAGGRQRLGADSPRALALGGVQGQHPVPEGRAAGQQAAQRLPLHQGIVSGRHAPTQRCQHRSPLQALQGQAQGIGQARRGMHEAAAGVQLPQQVTGMVFKVTQQQADDLMLPVGLGLGHQARAE